MRSIFRFGLLLVIGVHDHDFPDDRFNLAVVTTPVGKHGRLHRSE